jgi:hypothetical protein
MSHFVSSHKYQFLASSLPMALSVFRSQDDLFRLLPKGDLKALAAAAALRQSSSMIVEALMLASKVCRSQFVAEEAGWVLSLGLKRLREK